MRITRIYQDTILMPNNTIALDKSSSHYLGTVMRSSIGDTCHVFDGKGNEFSAEINTLNKNLVTVNLLEKIDANLESPLSIHLIQGLCKGDKMDFILQKSIELGVTEITPIFSQYCDVKLNQERIEKKMQYWKKIIISATEQSGRSTLAKLNYPLRFYDLMEDNTEFHQQLLLSPRAEFKFKHLLTTHQIKNAVTLYIGPEGGFSPSEETLALNNNVLLLN